MDSVNILKIIAETSRLRILNLLIEERLCVCELQEILDLPQVSVSKHLTKIRELGITKTNKQANRIFYALSEDFNKNTWTKNLLLELRKNESKLKQDYENLKKHNNGKEEKEYNCPN